MRERILIENTESGKPTLVLEHGGGSLAVYSRHDPERDGLRFYQKKNREQGKALSGLLFFIGVGLGYHILPFADSALVERIVVLEPDEALYQKVKHIDSVKRLVKREDVELHVGADIDVFLREVEGNYDYVYHDTFRVIRYQRLHQAYQDVYNALENRLHEQINSLLGDASTIGRFAALWINNYIRNRARPVAYRSVSALFGRYSGTVVVLGAGPSLDHVIADLGTDRSALYLIATDAALKPLLRHGIRPNLLISMDPQHTVYYHMAGLRSEDIRDIPAVLHLLCSHHIFSLFKEKYLYATRHPLSQVPDIGRDQLFNYTAVSSLACAVAVEMGFDSIVLAGFDFAFTGMRAYAWESFFYDYCVHNSFRLRTPDTVEMQSIRKRGVNRLQDYGVELEFLLEHVTGSGKPCVYNWKSGGKAIGHTHNISTLPGDLKRFKERLSHMDESMLPTGEAPDKEELSSFLLQTLELRERIYRHAADRKYARDNARQCLHKIRDIWTRGFKV